MTTADLVRAIDLALVGKWDEAHGIVQQDEADRTAAWIHAVLHTIEGDSSNARKVGQASACHATTCPDPRRMERFEMTG